MAQRRRNGRDVVEQSGRNGSVRQRDPDTVKQVQMTRLVAPRRRRLGTHEARVRSGSG